MNYVLDKLKIKTQLKNKPENKSIFKLNYDDAYNQELIDLVAKKEKQCNKIKRLYCMKIYTYYENVGMPDQEETIALWKQNWSESGFEPIVLRNHHAKSHPRYKEIKELIAEIHLDGAGVKMESVSYWLSVHTYHLAFDSQIQDSSLVIDYDLFNLSLDPNFCIPKEFTYHDGCCACCCSGKTGDFMSWLELCIQHKSTLKEKIKQDHKKTGRQHYGNDFFLDALHQEFQNDIGTILPSDQKFIASAWHHRHNKPRDLSDSKMVHFSTHCSSAYAKFNKIHNSPRIARNLFIREFLFEK